MKYRNGKFFLFLMLLLPAFGVFAAEPPRGEWRCVALTPRYLALTGDYSELQRKIFLELMEEHRESFARKPQWARDFIFNVTGIKAIVKYRPAVAAMLRESPAVSIVSAQGKVAIRRTGYWMNPIGQARFPDEHGRDKLSRNADVAHYLFIELERPLQDGEKIDITLPAGEKLEFTRRTSSPTPIIRINQVGYMPGAPKYAYLGAWLGTAGAMPLHREFSGAKFALVDAATGKAVFTGELKARPDDPVNANGTPFTGEEVLELDFSAFDTPGRYYLAVDNVGRSEEFRIDNDTMAEAFYIHARGLYHQRCGIAKGKPYTNWTMPTCHQQCVRGNFPPESSHYFPGDESRPYGFRDATGKSLKITHFKLIAQNAPATPELLNAPGGWHDAADWDRRSQHLGIVGDLAAVYLLRPNNFCDGQLDLPESGNGIPDLLDEARWGIEHLRLKQQSNGGVGTWIETTRHPTPNDGSSADDKLTYYLSCATRNSTLEYAAYAAELALALRQAGAEEAAANLCDSARRAWDFALDPKNRVRNVYVYDGSDVFYDEGPELAHEYVVKAGFDLYQLTEDKRYLEAAEQAAKPAFERMKRNSWSWSPFFWIELEIFPCYSPDLKKLHRAWRKGLVSQARQMLRRQEENYPIRVPWFAADEGWVHAMSWGTSHPLRCARVLVAAHAITGDTAFLDGACLANDFHNGANPFGASMTSGLGRVYPVRFLDLNSYADGIAEFVPGITPYRNTYGLPHDAVAMGYGLFYPAKKRQGFDGLALSLLPRAGLKEKECLAEVGRLYPIWRRWGNVEGRTVAASEFTVWETIAPAVAVTGYLLDGARPPAAEWKNRQPAEDIRKLPGYAPLP